MSVLPPPDLDALSLDELKKLVVQLLVRLSASVLHGWDTCRNKARHGTKRTVDRPSSPRPEGQRSKNDRSGVSTSPITARRNA